MSENTLTFGGLPGYRAAMKYATDIVEAIQGTAHFPSVSITPNWSIGRVEIQVPIGSPLGHTRLTSLNVACRACDCGYLIRTHEPSGEFFDKPFIEIYAQGDET